MAIAKKITINDVAQAAGVSMNAVSLILNDKGRISSTAGERINQVIEQLGFMHNHQAALLRDGQNGAIGLIVSGLSEPFYAELTVGLIDTLERQGRMVFLAQGERSGEKIDQRFDTPATQGVDGVIIAGSIDRGNELYEWTIQVGMPLAFAPHADYPDGVDLIRPDNIQATRLVTEHLIRRGHQRIAWLDGQSFSLACAERAGGYCAALLKCGLPSHSEWVLECESSQKQATEAMAGLSHQNPTIIAVLCYSNMVATGVWFGSLRTGRQNGEDGIESYLKQRIALAVFVDVPEATLDDLPLTWVVTPAHEMGKTLAELTLRWLEESTGETRNQIMPPRLVIRK